MKKLIRVLKSIFARESLDDSINYMSAGFSLPEPLCEAEEEQKLNELKTGDSTVKKLLIEHNLRLVVYIARKFDNTGIDLDDLISVGTIGLIKAINSYDLDKKIKLATYASRCIENEILMHLRRVSKIKGEVSFDEPLNVDWEGNELLLSDVLGTDSDVVSKNLETCCEREQLSVAINRLKPREKRIMQLRFGLGLERDFTQKEVADILGISQSYISRLEKKIVARLKKEISKTQIE